MTICFQCKHLVKKSRKARIWYDLGCQRHVREKRTCPMTGEMVADGSGVEISTETYKYCRDVNTGECPDYETRG